MRGLWRSWMFEGVLKNYFPPFLPRMNAPTPPITAAPRNIPGMISLSVINNDRKAPKISIAKRAAPSNIPLFASSISAPSAIEFIAMLWSRFFSAIERMRSAEPGRISSYSLKCFGCGIGPENCSLTAIAVIFRATVGRSRLATFPSSSFSIASSILSAIEFSLVKCSA